MSGTEVEHLLRWKREATEVIAEWEKVYDALGKPGALGESKTTAALHKVTSLRAAISQAIEDLDAEHQLDEFDQRLGCVLCWPKSAGWPCGPRMVADDLRQALGGDE